MDLEYATVGRPHPAAPFRVTGQLQEGEGGRGHSVVVVGPREHMRYVGRRERTLRNGRGDREERAKGKNHPDKDVDGLL
jgi:hypothetical protein